MAIKVIEAKNEGLKAYFQRVWNSRRLIMTFARRDIKAQYAQTLLGLLWSAIQPLTGLLVFSIFFGYLMEIELPGDISYPIFAFSGMIPWYYFTFLIAHSGTSLVNNQELIKRVNFPKMALPLSKTIVGMVDLVISLLILLIMMIIFGALPSINLIALPVFILLNLILGLAIGLWLSALTIRFRDFQHIIPYLVNFGIWLTPVFYPTTIIPEKFSFLIYLNPMAGVIAGFRWSILGLSPPDSWFWISFAVGFVMLISGALYFRKVEKTISDYV